MAAFSHSIGARYESRLFTAHRGDRRCELIRVCGRRLVCRFEHRAPGAKNAQRPRFPDRRRRRTHGPANAGGAGQWRARKSCRRPTSSTSRPDGARRAESRGLAEYGAATIRKAQATLARGYKAALLTERWARAAQRLCGRWGRTDRRRRRARARSRGWASTSRATRISTLIISSSAEPQAPPRLPANLFRAVPRFVTAAQASQIDSATAGCDTTSCRRHHDPQGMRRGRLRDRVLVGWSYSSTAALLRRWHSASTPCRPRARAPAGALPAPRG